jgi:peroxiredoxin
MGVRGAAFWGVAGAGALLAIGRASGAGTTAELAAYRVCEALMLALGLLAVFLAGAAAGRDRRTSAEEVVLSKPAGSAPTLAVVRFAALWVSLIAAAVVALVAASLGQVVLARTPWHAYPYLHALARTVLPVSAAAGLGFCLSTVFHTPLASAVAAIYWIIVPLTLTYTPMAFDLRLSQHWPVAALLVAFLVTLTAALYARSVRDPGKRSGRMAWVAALLLIALGLSAYRTATNGEDVLTTPDPILAAMQSQSVHADERAPGFWLRDERGRLVGMSDFAGHPVILTFWGPAAPDSAQALSDLRKIAGEYGPSGLRCVAVCVDPDAAAMGPFAREAGEVVMLWDRGRHFGEGVYQRDSPLAVAYDVTELPAVYVLDRERRVRAQTSAGVSLQWLRHELVKVTVR